MPTSAPGSKPFRRGFTLIELLVVLLLVAVAAATLSLAIRDPLQAQLEREAERLVALLETGRAEARAAGLAVRWKPGASADDPAQAFAFVGLPQRTDLPRRWLGEPVAVELEGGARELVLGPEPLLPRQSLRLRLGEHELRIASDGLKPLEIAR
jgi:general secretion pathway protein H